MAHSPDTDDYEVTGWTGVHVWLFRDPREVDVLLIARIAPLLNKEREVGNIRAWYFLRYWTEGPHLRLRLRDAGEADLERIRREVEAVVGRPESEQKIDAAEYFAAFGTDGVGGSLRHDGESIHVAYVPETERYGGSDSITAAETLFVVSSTIACAVIGATLGQLDRRRAVAFDLLIVFLQSAGWPPGEAVQQARNYFFGWDRSTETSPLRPIWLVAEARAVYNNTPHHWAARWSTIANRDASMDEDAYAIWGSGLREYSDGMRQAGASASSVNRAIWSQMHMLMNRLGISVPEERILVWLAASSIEGSADDVDPTLRYLASTRPPRSITAGLPKAHDSASALTRRRPIALEGPDPTSALRSTLLSRRSVAAGYRAALTAEQLGAVLGSITGPEGRTHPSPGGLNPTITYAYIRHVPGVPNGIYRHDAEGALLQPTGALLDDSDFVAASPYLRFDEDPATSVANAQVVLALVPEMPRLVPKYGPLALRLALLDVGHVSQVLVTAATELGLGTLVVGGFDEDALNASLHLDGVNRFVAQLIVVGAK